MQSIERRMQKSAWQTIVLGLIVSLSLSLLACGGGDEEVEVTISPTTATVALGATVQFNAVVTGDDDTSVTWSVNDVAGGNSTVGTVSTQGLYTAPSNALNSSSVSVTATSVADTEKSASATVTINSGAKVTVYPTDGVTIGAGETYQFTDTVTNTPDENPSTAVYWFVNDVEGGNSASGTITTAGFYTAPAQVGASTTFVIKAAWQSDQESYGTTNVTVVPAGAPTLSSLNPSSVAQGAAFEDIYLSGSNFVSNSIVRVNGEQVESNYVSDSVLRARVPADDLANTGTLFVDVQQQSGALSSAVRLNVVSSPTALISTSPDSTAQNGGALSITFQGGYYTSATTAQFNGKQAGATVQNSRQLNAAVDASNVTTAGLYSASVRNTAYTNRMSAANLAVTPADSPSVLTTLTVGSSPASVAINPATGIAVVANSGTGTNGNTISLINLDPSSSNYLRQIGSLAVGTAPTSVAIDYLRNYAVTANNGDNSISVIDISNPSAPTLKATITDGLDVRPYAVGVNPYTGQALVAYQNSSNVNIIDLTTFAVTATGQITTTGANPQIAVDPRLGWGIVTPGGSGAVSVVDFTRSGRNIVSLIAVPSSNGVSRSGGTVTVTTSDAHGLAVGEEIVIAGVDDASFNGTFTVASVTSATTFTYTQAGSDTTSGNGTVSAEAPLITISLNQDMRGIAINTETERAIFADPSSTSVTMMSLLDQTITTITLETGIVAAAVNPLTNTAIVVNSVDNSASVLDLKNQRRTAQFILGAKPASVAVDPVTNLAVTANQSDNTVTIVALGGIRPLHMLQMYPTTSLTSTSSQTLRIIGNGFNAGSVVRFNETPLATTYVSPREVQATVSSSMLGSPEKYVADVLNTDGSVSNVKHFTVMQAIAVGTSPRGVAIDRERNLAVVTNTGSDSVSVINLKSLSISGTLRVGDSPQGVAVCSVKGRAAVTNTESDTVSIIDLDNIAVSSTLSVAPSSGTSKPVGIAIHPGSGKAIVADNNATQVSFFDVSSPGTPSTLTIDVGPNAVAIDPTRNIAAVAESLTGTIVLVDLATEQVLSRVTGFQLPTGAIYDPDSDSFLITSSLSNNIGSVIADPDTETYTVAFNRMGINPTSIDYNYRSSTLVTTNTTSQTMSVMDFVSKTVQDIIPLSVSQQFAVAIDPVSNRAVVVDQNNNRVLIVPLPK